jgi:hypothetical protein
MRQLLLLSAILCITLLATPALAQQCSTSWAGPSSGNWNEPQWWTNGVPAIGSVVCITAPGDYQVLIPVDVIVQELHLGADSGTQTLLSTRSVSLQSAGTSVIGASGRWLVTRSSGTVNVNVASTLLVEGEVSLAQSISFMTSGGTLDVAPGGRFEMIGGADAGGAESLFRIRGTLDAAQCAGTSSGDCQLNAPIEVDGGTIRVGLGQLQLRGGTLHDLTVDVAEGSTLRLANGNDGYVVTGTLAGAPAGTVLVQTTQGFKAGPGDATLALGGSGLRWGFPSASFARVESAGGNFVNTGLLVASGNSGGVYGDIEIENHGELRVESWLSLVDAGTTIRNTATGLLEVTGPSTASLSGNGRVVSEGGEVVASCSGTCSIQTPLDMQGGTVSVASGQLNLSGGMLHDLTVDVAEGSTLRLANGNDGYVVTGTLAGAPAGTVLVQTTQGFKAGPGDATLALGGSGLRWGFASASFARVESAGGNFINTGLLVASGNSGGVYGDLEIENHGELRVESWLSLVDAGTTIRNTATGLLEVTGPSTASLSGNGRVVSEGGEVVASCSGTCSIQTPLDMQGGTVSVMSGRLDLSRGGTLDAVLFSVPEGAQLWVYGAGINRLWALNGTLSGEIGGDLRWFGADFTAGPSEVVLDFTGEGLELSGQTGFPTALESEGGQFRTTGRIRVAGSSGWGIGSRGATVLNEGRIELTFPFRFWEDGLLRNEPGGVIQMMNGGFVDTDGQGIVQNYGLIERNGNATAVGFDGTLRSMPGSELRALTGRLDLDPPGEHSFPEETTVTGIAQVRLITGLTVGGTISPGTAEQPIATQEFVSSLQMSPTTRTVIDIDANGQSDTIIPASGVNSTMLDGTLVVRVADGFTPSAGDEWTIFLRSANPYMIQGEFHTIEIEGNVPEGVGFITVKPNDGVVVLRAIAGVASIAASAGSTTEGGAPVTFTVTSSAAAPPGSALEIPLAFEGTATRYLDYVVDITGNTRSHPRRADADTITLFPLADDQEEDDETVTIRLLPGGDIAPGPDDAATVIIQDGPLTSGLAVGGIAPSRGGTGGLVSATIFGQGMGPGSAVRLVRGGTVIEGANVTDNGLGTGLGATFDLRGAATGPYDVVVDHGGSSSTLAGAFTVEENDGVQLWADIVGTPNPRNLRWSTYTLTLGNSGNVDLHDIVVLLRMTRGLEIELPDIPCRRHPPGSDRTDHARHRHCHGLAALRIPAGGRRDGRFSGAHPAHSSAGHQ